MTFRYTFNRAGQIFRIPDELGDLNARPTEDSLRRIIDLMKSTQVLGDNRKHSASEGNNSDPLNNNELPENPYGLSHETHQDSTRIGGNPAPAYRNEFDDFFDEMELDHANPQPPPIEHAELNHHQEMEWLNHNDPREGPPLPYIDPRII